MSNPQWPNLGTEACRPCLNHITGNEQRASVAERPVALPPASHRKAKHMPRYFFNIKDETETPDLKGIELLGLDEARNVARSIANDLTRNGEGARRITIVVTDQYDNPAFEVTGV